MESLIKNYLFFIPTLTGLIAFVVSIITIFFPPKSINAWYGYRTAKSMQSQETWDFAQKYSSSIMLKSSLLLILLGITGFFIGNIGIGGLAIGMLSMMLMFIYTIIRTEKELSVRFFR